MDPQRNPQPHQTQPTPTSYAPRHEPCGVSNGPNWRFVGLDRHRPAIERYLRARVSDENDVQDLVQETLLRAARYRKPGQEPASLRGWLIRIAANLRVDAVNRRCTEEVQGQNLDALPERCDERTGGEQAESGVSWAGRWWSLDEILQHLRAGWKRLSEADRHTLSGYYFDDLSGAELAHGLDVRPELIKVRLFRARRRLARWMELRMRATRRADWGWA